MSQPVADANTDAFIERIVREVIRRLLAMDASQQQRQLPRRAATNPFTAAVVSAPHSISENLITAASLEAIPTGTTELLIPRRAVVTPLARDEAKSKGIRLTRADHLNQHKPGANG